MFLIASRSLALIKDVFLLEKAAGVSLTSLGGILKSFSANILLCFLCLVVGGGN